jgi:hypothetical protein
MRRPRPVRGLPTRVYEEGSGRDAGGLQAHVSPWGAFKRASRRDLYVLFLESEQLPHEVVESLPEEGIRRVLGSPADVDVASIRTRLARTIDEKRALLKPFRRARQGMSLAQATLQIAEAWAESDAARRSQQHQASAGHRPNGTYFRSGWKSVPSATQN